MRLTQAFRAASMVFAFSCTLLFGNAFATDAQKEYVIGVENIKYLPMYNTDEAGNYTGYAYELFELFAKKKNIKFIYEARPVARLFQEFVKEDRFDFKYPDNPNWQKEMKENDKKEKGVGLTYSSKIIKFIDGVLVKPENKDKSITFLKKLATVRGFTPFVYLDKKEVQIVENSTTEALLELVKQKNGKVDGAYFNIAVADYLLKQEGFANALVFNKNLPYDEDFYHISTKKHPQLIAEFNTFLIEEKSAIEEIKKKYGLQNY